MQWETITTKLRNLAKAKTRKIDVVELSKNTELVAIDSSHLEASEVNKLALEAKAKMNKGNKLLVNLGTSAGNRETESHTCTFTASLEMNSKSET